MFNTIDTIDTIDTNKSIIIIDTSYLIFYRFFALRLWYKRAFKDKDIPDDYNWLEDTIFIDKYKKLFFQKILKICKKQKIPLNNIIFTFDCLGANNWRKKINNTYKATRYLSHKKANFNCFELFNIAKNNYIKIFSETHNCLTFYHQNLEADDIVYLIINQCKDINFTSNIYILASDHDYLQLCCETIKLIDLKENIISKNIINNTDNIKFLITKILIGDVSDNINACYISNDFLKKYNIIFKNEYIKCTKKNIELILNNADIYKIILNTLLANRKFKFNIENLNDIFSKNKQFSANQLLIDMHMIPYNIKDLIS